jgi:hypothetical protein
VHKLLIYTVDKLPQTIKDDVVAWGWTSLPRHL